MCHPFLQGVVDRVIVPFASWPTVDPSVITAEQAILIVSSEKNSYHKM